MIRSLTLQARFQAWQPMLAGAMGLGLAVAAAAADSDPSTYRITVNSALDGTVAADVELTLREAILLANHELALEDLSQVEQGLVTPIKAPGSIIEFELPDDDRVIELVDLLPPITTSAVVIDGTSQPGYGEVNSAVAEIPTPAVSVTPAPGAEVFRGFTITADGVTVRGLSLHGFRARHRATQTTPPADIFISNAPPPADAGPASPPVSFFQFQDPALAPKDVVIELNWLGMPPDESIPETRSAFGVSVFNGVDTVVRQNRIQHHEGSGVITAVRAQGLQLTDNVILGNGVAGMPDAVRLEGQIEGAMVTDNLICGNDGSGLFLFKPEGASLIQGNDIRFNGRRFERAAVYLMGRGHQVLDNTIGYQPGPGVAISAFPRSDRNLIRNNRFTHLDGLSIDLAANDNTGVQDFQQADGPNPPRNSYNRRLDTANGAINAPEFDQDEFGADTETTQVTGKADPGSEVDIYQVVEGEGAYGPLDTPLTTVTADGQGSFQLSWEKSEGTWLSAIATDPLYGTSEPSPVVKVLGSEGTAPDRSPQRPYTASCLPEPVAADPPPPEPLQLRVPRNIHFALDRSDISPESAAILDQVAAVMQQYSFLVIELRGHTDPRASAAYNQALSQRRALAAREYLLRQGIAPERLRILPLGESQRATSGDTRLDYARDRRVEFIFLDTRGLEIIFEAQESDLQIEP